MAGKEGTGACGSVAQHVGACWRSATRLPVSSRLEQSPRALCPAKLSDSPLAARARSPLAESAAGDRAAPSPKMMENAVFMSFTFYSTILILKMYVVAIITGQVRLRKKAFANPEDALRNGGLQYHREDPDVERCRRRVCGGAGIPPAPRGHPGQLLAKKQWEAKGLIN
ncbi:prostaglandin e hypothetical protein [Limosa lapponica baueri]|uniref:Uncharacterized protein n=1 Tax=Limosa lapponica baueri TaxID=1758121 RepID=A0A2I0TPM7_LIMLA|nr:prostaglandin e hypothetical protein [Limosa lapponica baueri]